jgi:hypothetical protein
MRDRTGSHVLLSTPRSSQAVQTIAAREGWRSEVVEARLFRVLKVWVENALLIECLTPEMHAAYVETFGGGGLAMLDSKLRELEAVAVGRR